MASNPQQPPMELVNQPKSSVSVLSGPYGHPFHPLAVTIPIGAWVASLVFDLVSRAGEDPTPFARGAMWLIGIGVIGALVAAVLGLMDLMNIPRGTRAWRTGLTHMTLNLLVTTAFAISWGIRVTADYEVTPIWLIIYSAVALAVLSVSGWLGGKMTYSFGIRVAEQGKQADGFRPTRPARAPRKSA